MSHKNKNLVEDKNLAFDLATVESMDRNMSLHIKEKAGIRKKGLASLLGISAVQREAKQWQQMAERQADRAEKVLTTDFTERAKHTIQLCKTTVPHFDSAKGRWPGGSDSVSSYNISWKTDPETGVKTTQLMRYEHIESGMWYQHYVTISGNEEPTLFTRFGHITESGRVVVKPTKVGATHDPSSLSASEEVNYRLRKKEDMLYVFDGIDQILANADSATERPAA